jgi:hypothetical protein
MNAVPFTALIPAFSLSRIGLSDNWIRVLFSPTVREDGSVFIAAH